jgi:hypothetical protein
MKVAQKQIKSTPLHIQMSAIYVTGLREPPSWFYVKQALRGHFLLKMSYTTIDRSLADNDNASDWHMFAQTGHELSFDTFSSLLKRLPQFVDCKMGLCDYGFQDSSVYMDHKPLWVDMTGSSFL